MYGSGSRNAIAATGSSMVQVIDAMETTRVPKKSAEVHADEKSHGNRHHADGGSRTRGHPLATPSA